MAATVGWPYTERAHTLCSNLPAFQPTDLTDTQTSRSLAAGSTMYAIQNTGKSQYMFNMPPPPPQTHSPSARSSSQEPSSQRVDFCLVSSSEFARYETHYSSPQESVPVECVCGRHHHLRTPIPCHDLSYSHPPCRHHLNASPTRDSRQDRALLSRG